MKKTVSLLLALVMLLGLMPAISREVKAADVCEVDTWEELREAFLAEGRLEIHLVDNVYTEYTYEDSLNAKPLPELHVKGEKTLHLYGYTVFCNDISNIHISGNQNPDGLRRDMVVIEEGASLTVDATNPIHNGFQGEDGVVYKNCFVHWGGLMDQAHHYKNFIIRNVFRVYGTLILNGGTYIAGDRNNFPSFWNDLYQCIWGNVIYVESGGHAIVNHANINAYGSDVDAQNVALCVGKDGTLDLNNSHIRATYGARPMWAHKNSTVNIRDLFTYKFTMDDMRMISSSDPVKREDGKPAVPGYPDSAWKSEIDRMYLKLAVGDGDLHSYTSFEDKNHFNFEYDGAKVDYMQMLYYAGGQMAPDKLNWTVTDNGHTQPGTASSLTFDPASGGARVQWNYQPYFVNAHYSPEYTIQYQWRVWKGSDIESRYTTPDYTVTTNTNYIDLEKQTQIPWASSPEWTVECYVTEQFEKGWDDIRSVVKHQTQTLNVKIDALSFTSQIPSMGGQYIVDYDYTVGESAPFAFTYAPLSQSQKNEGYSIHAGQYLFAGNSFFYNGSNQPFDLKDYITEPGEYTLWQSLELKKDGKNADIERRIFYIHAKGNPKVLQGSVAYISDVVYEQPVKITLTGMAASIDKSLLRYQWQYQLGGQWYNVGGATASSFAPTEYHPIIRVKVTAEGYEGELYSAAKTVKKQDNLTMPGRPTLTSSQKTVTITNYNAGQEYVYSTRELDGTTWSNGTAISGNTFTVPDYGTYYVYTRFKADKTHNTGSYLNYNWITPTADGTGETIKAWKLYYPQYPTSGDTVFVPLGKTVYVDYAINPTNANYDLPKIIPMDASVAKATQYTSSKQMAITGQKLGTTYLYAVNSSGYNWYDHPNKSTYSLYVRVYDPNNMGYGDFSGNAQYPNVTLTEGDSYTPQDPRETGVTLYPEEAMDIFTNYRWYTGVSTMTGFSYATVDGNGVIQVDPATGKITALKPGQATVYLFALKDADKNNVPSTSINNIGHYTVTVEAAPEVPVESIDLHPDTLSMEAGKTFDLQLTFAPGNANTFSTKTVSSSNPTVATVTSDLKITALAPGKTTVTVTMGSLSASCEVTVYAANHEHTGQWIDDSDVHYRVCEICGKLEEGEHEWGEWTVVMASDCENPGLQKRACKLCGGERTNPVAALGHIDNSWEHDADGHWVQCLRAGCGKMIRPKEAHEYTTDTSCDVCGYTPPEVDHTPECPRDHTCPMCQFNDLDPKRWYHDGVHYCIAKGLMNGQSSTRFGPNVELTRAMVVVLLYRMEGSPAVSGSVPFEDVEAGKWYTDAVIWAQQNGIATGISSTKFDPFGSVTRQQTAAFMFRYAQLIGMDTSARALLDQFPDAEQVSGYAVDAVSWAVAEGIIQGVAGDGVDYLKPKGTTTRAQYATIVYRFLEN